MTTDPSRVSRSSGAPATPGSFADLAIVGAVAVIAFAVFLRTRAPSIVALFDDTTEFPLAVDRLAILHPTGYPLYTLVARAFSLLPTGEFAARLSLFSGLMAALGAAAVVAVIGETILALTGRRTMTDRLAGAAGGLLFAFLPAFWANAVVPETYTMAVFLAAITMWAGLRAVRRGTGVGFVALLIGLGLTHHRTFVLILPALAAYALVVGWRRDPRPTILQPTLPWADRARWLWRSFWPALPPLLLYLYLPIRGHVGSIDGTYRNDPVTFFLWVSGAWYGSFLADNPLARDGNPLATYVALVGAQFPTAALVCATLGAGWMALRRSPVGLAVALWYGATAAFAVLYRVRNPEDYALMSFIALAVMVGVGFVGVTRAFAAIGRAIGARVGAATLSVAASLAILVVPVVAAVGHYDDLDRSAETTVRAYALDALRQPIAASGAIVGILGETTAIQYAQRALGARPDVVTRAADTDPERLAAVEALLAEGREVYITRPLPGLAERYALSSVGPLTLVERTPPLAPPPGLRPVGRRLGPVELIGFTIEPVPDYGLGVGGPSDLRAAQRSLRVTLFWRPSGPIAEDVRVFVHFLDGQGDRWTQSDSAPVRGAYPTPLWRPGAVVADAHDLPLPLGTPPGDYAVVVGLTRADGSPFVVDGQRFEARLGATPIDPRPGGYTRRRLDLDPTFVRFGSVTLVGERASPTPIAPGAVVLVETLWRADREMPNSLVLQAELVGDGRVIALGSAPLGGRHPSARWAPGEFVRDRQRWRVPVTTPDGRYTLRLSVGDGQTATVGRVEVRGRPLVTAAPAVANRSGVTLGGRMELVGWEARRAEAANTVDIALVWRATGPIDNDFAVFVHLVGPDGRIVAQHDSSPANGDAPTGGWRPGEVIRDAHPVRLPEGVPPETLRLRVGMYDPITGRRVTGPQGDDIALGTLRLSQ